MKSANFEILRQGWPELAELGAFAEAYAHADPASALVKLRQFAENLTKDIYRDLQLPKPDQPTFVDLLKNQAFSAITPRVILDKLHALRIHGNKAAHGEEAKPQNALWLLREAHDLARWLLVQHADSKAADIPTYTQPMTPQAAEARERRQILEKLAVQEAQMDALLRELDVARQVASAAEKKAEELQAIAATANAAADELQFDEATTRTRLIDSQLASVGWNVAMGEASTEEVGKEIEVRHQPTESGSGYADYVLRDDNGNPLAVIEAKKTSIEPERGRAQAKLYADGLEKTYGHRPVIFYTNGFDIWIWDDAQGFPPRKLYGFYSKDSLQHLANYQRKERKPSETTAWIPAALEGSGLTRITMVQLFNWWSDVLLHHLAARPDLRMLWAVEAVSIRIVKRLLVYNPTARDKILTTLSEARFALPEETLASLFLSPGTNMLIVLESAVSIGWNTLARNAVMAIAAIFVVWRVRVSPNPSIEWLVRNYDNFRSMWPRSDERGISRARRR